MDFFSRLLVYIILMTPTTSISNFAVKVNKSPYFKDNTYITYHKLLKIVCHVVIANLLAC